MTHELWAQTATSAGLVMRGTDAELRDLARALVRTEVGRPVTYHLVTAGSYSGEPTLDGSNEIAIKSGRAPCAAVRVQRAHRPSPCYGRGMSSGDSSYAPGGGPIDPDIVFAFDGHEYRISREKLAAGLVMLPDQRLLRLVGWDGDVPQFTLADYAVAEAV